MKQTFLHYPFTMKKRIWLNILWCLLIAINYPGCTADRYQQQANAIKDHVETFYSHLQSHQIDQAMSENQKIETVALTAEERLLRHVGQMKQSEKIQEWKIVKTAKETAAENWLALARYFLEIRQYYQARNTYRRIIKAYQNSPYHSYATRAEAGLQDITVILNKEENPVPSVK